ncbi:MAG: S46 family peptidase [Bacteroidales bacterium]|nr:S46 family peptidase [Bacteroidales bacterium]HOY37660.1 S46 family peptidase [Bacteroidales bacterium]HQP04188.1 S46 family peptidase [Bacteroidales bacterium]
MKKFAFLLVSLVILISGTLRADEGMWLLSLIGKNYDDMKAKGFQLTPDDIYNINNACIKDAIVGLSREGRPFWHFCSGEIISDQGLILTNHHCGYGMIQAHSSIEHDYLKDGFWAYSKDQELPNEGYCAEILIRIEDVTSRVMKSVTSEMGEADRNAAIKEASSEIIKEAEKGTYYSAQVSEMFHNNQYFLLVYEIYKDIRLVGAPPSSMGKFGGDTDNWMWPRHTADFSMFRIYTGPDGKPAAYAKENIPLKPRYSLPISIAGVKEGDFAMILGFPGTTDRYLTSYGLQETIDITNTYRYNIRTVKLDILRNEMKNNPEVRIQYASKYASSSNYWKYSHEQNIALQKLNTIENKRAIENEFVAWTNADNNRKAKYGNVLNNIKNIYESRKADAYNRQFILEALLQGAEIPLFAYQISNQIGRLNENSTAADKEKIKTSIHNFYKNFDANTDKKLVAAMFSYYASNVDPMNYPTVFLTIIKKYKGNFDKFAADMFLKSVFSDEQKLLALVDAPNAKILDRDPAVIAGNSIYTKYQEINQSYRDKSSGLEREIRLFNEGLMEMNSDKMFYPDANSTIRLTYGNVLGYRPADAINYKYYTTLEGVMQKEDPNNDEFIVPEKLKELYKNNDFGRYTNAEGKLVTGFITNNDITGGNSGSPVLNGKGELIGTAFDGNSEAMSGDIDFEENLQRCINLDVRYTLFIIDKYANAQNLINEMNIVE